MRKYRFRASRQEGKSGLALATAIVLLLAFSDFVTGGSLRGFVRTSAARAWSASAYVRDAVFGSGYFSSRAALSKEIRALQETLSSLQEEAAAYRIVRRENEEMRTLLGLAHEVRGITAPIASSISTSPFGTLLIGAGERDGVEPGDLVLTPGGFLVGTVSEVYEDTSSVRELFSAGAEVGTLVGDAPVLLKGRGGGNAVATLPREVRIEEGDGVVAPSFMGRAVGVVGKVEKDASDAEQRIFVHLPVNMATLRFVYVVER